MTEEKISEAQELYKAHFGRDFLNVVGWRYIARHHKGHLPIRIRAVLEGTVVPTHNVLFTVENTDPAVPWITNWLETLLVEVWYPMTVATNSRAWKTTIARYLQYTGTPSQIDFKLHDFGFRGSTSPESAGIGGLAHLVNFKGTDTIQALVVARKYYASPMAGFSIAAAEHSTMTSWGVSGEESAFRNMLTQFSDVAMACVSDSYNI